MTSILRRYYVLIIIFVVIVAGIITWEWVFREQEKSVGSRKANYEFASEKLVNEFEKDENSANKLYLNKVIEVSGNIDSFSENEKEITVLLKNSGEQSGVSCSFDKSVTLTSTFKKGDAIKVKGICNGYLIDVVLNRCTITKP